MGRSIIQFHSEIIEALTEVDAVVVVVVMVGVMDRQEQALDNFSAGIVRSIGGTWRSFRASIRGTSITVVVVVLCAR